MANVGEIDTVVVGAEDEAVGNVRRVASFGSRGETFVLAGRQEDMENVAVTCFAAEQGGGVNDGTNIGIG